MYKEGSGYDSKGKEGWKGWIGGLGKMRSVSVGPQVISYLIHSPSVHSNKRDEKLHEIWT